MLKDYARLNVITMQDFVDKKDYIYSLRWVISRGRDEFTLSKVEVIIRHGYVFLHLDLTLARV
jgi:hypothetical protein